jgi:hypothetical protein
MRDANDNTRVECTVFHPHTGVHITQAYDGVGIILQFGDWPYTHTTWHLDDEGELDVFVKNLLAAEMEYIRQTKGTHPLGQAPQPKENDHAEEG